MKIFAIAFGLLCGSAAMGVEVDLGYKCKGYIVTDQHIITSCYDIGRTTENVKMKIREDSLDFTGNCESIYHQVYVCNVDEDLSTYEKVSLTLTEHQYFKIGAKVHAKIGSKASYGSTIPQIDYNARYDLFKHSEGGEGIFSNDGELMGFRTKYNGVVRPGSIYSTKADLFYHRYKRSVIYTKLQQYAITNSININGI